MAYLDFILIASTRPHEGHSNVRKSWSGSPEGSLRTSSESAPHLEHSGRYSWASCFGAESIAHAFPECRVGAQAGVADRPTRAPHISTHLPENI